tara:strand:+ start:95 stop:421 length:327 start_codon:yes stop_codon:yes gene_type:complete
MYDKDLHLNDDLELPINDMVFTMCPYCRGNNLHQDKVAVWFGGEMSPFNDIQVVVDQEGISEGTSQEGNPSSRRDGLLIRFWCETCDNIPSLSISQHKGSTFIQWLTE